MGPSDLDALRVRVVDDPALRNKLLAVPERRAFVAEVIDIARTEGISLSADDVEEALRAAIREHREHWV
jgi:Nif11 domain